MGNLDRTIRVSIALIIGILIFMNIITGKWAMILGIIAGIFALTSVVSFCPLYVLFKIKTCPKK
jgi:hypothetical protein